MTAPEAPALRHIRLGPATMPYTGRDPATRRPVPSVWPMYCQGREVGELWRSPVTRRYSTYLNGEGATMLEHDTVEAALRERGLAEVKSSGRLVATVSGHIISVGHDRQHAGTWEMVCTCSSRYTTTVSQEHAETLAAEHAAFHGRHTG